MNYSNDRIIARKPSHAIGLILKIHLILYPPILHSRYENTATQNTLCRRKKKWKQCRSLLEETIHSTLLTNPERPVLERSFWMNYADKTLAISKKLVPEQAEYLFSNIETAITKTLPVTLGNRVTLANLLMNLLVLVYCIIKLPHWGGPKLILAAHQKY